MKFLIPIRLWSEANVHDHWRNRARRRKAQRDAVRWACGAIEPSGRVWKAYSVTLTRIAPLKLDTDNLQGAFKAIRDEVAELLGINDNSDDITWRYAQRKGARPREYAVEIDVEPVNVAQMEADHV